MPYTFSKLAGSARPKTADLSQKPKVDAGSKPSASNILPKDLFKEQPENFSERFYEGPNPQEPAEQFRQVTEEGVSITRPEIIALTNFDPAFIDDNVTSPSPAGLTIDRSRLISPSSPETAFRSSRITPAGKMLQVQVWAQELIRENMQRLVEILKSQPQLSDAIAQREKDFNDQFATAVRDVDFLYGLIKQLELIRSAINLKSSLADATFERKVKGLVGSPANDTVKAQISPSYIASEHFGFDTAKYHLFTNTKAYMQFVFDMYSMIDGFSYTLFDSSVQERKSDGDPVTINKDVASTKVGFGFNVRTLASQFATPRNGTVTTFHKDFISSLPASEDDRIKLLSVTLSRILRVSIALGDQQTVASIARNYPGITNAGDPFSVVFGTVGDRITDRVQGAPRSLASQAQLIPAGLQDEGFVLPFEDSYIGEIGHSATGTPTDQPPSQTYIPGTAYFVDSIVDSRAGTFDTSSIDSFVRNFGQSISAAQDAVGRLLQISSLSSSTLDRKARGIGVTDILGALIAIIRAQFDSLTPQERDDSIGDIIRGTVIEPSGKQVFVSALADSAQKNTILKNQLLRLILTAGVVSQQQGSSPGVFFDELVQTDELGLNGRNALAERDILIDAVADSLFRMHSFSSRGAGGLRTKSSVTRQIAGNDLYDTDDFFVQNLSKTDIASQLKALMSGVSSTNEITNGTWIGSFVSLMNTLSTLLTAGDAKLNGATRYRSLSASTIAMIVFELIVSIVSKYVPAFFGISSDTHKIRAVINTTENESMKSVVTRVQTRITNGFRITPTLAVQSEFEQSRTSELNSLINSVRSDETALVPTFRMLDRLHKTILNSVNSLKTGYIQSTNANATLSSIRNTLGTDTQLLLDPAQVRLSRSMVTEFTMRTAQQQSGDQVLKLPQRSFRDTVAAPSAVVNRSMFIDERVPSESVISAMWAMLRDPEFLMNGDVSQRIISVGIPAGFSENLKRKFRLSDVTGNTFSGRAQDVVSVNVYKVDEQYDGLVFKPIKRIFELSRFVSRLSEFETRPDQTFENVLPLMKMIDLSTDQQRSVESFSESDPAQLLNNSEYDFLSVDQIKSLRKNHIKSALLQFYMYYMTGAFLGERLFTVGKLESEEERIQASQFLRSTLRQYASNIVGRDVNIDALVGDVFSKSPSDLVVSTKRLGDASETLDIPGVPGDVLEKLTSELRTFLSLFNTNTILSDGLLQRRSILTPKIFERVFHVNFDANSFVVDKTESDQETVKKLIESGRIINKSGDLLFVPRDPQAGESRFEKYFVSIETVLPQLGDAGNTRAPISAVSQGTDISRSDGLASQRQSSTPKRLDLPPRRKANT